MEQGLSRCRTSLSFLEIVMSQSNQQIFGLCNIAVQSAAELMSAYLDGVERLQDSQSKALKNILAEQASSAKKLEKAKGLEELIEIQSALIQKQMAATMRLCSDFFTASSASQMACMRQTQSRMLNMVGELGLQFKESSASASGDPLMQFMQQIMEAAKQTCVAGFMVTEAPSQKSTRSSTKHHAEQNQAGLKQAA